MFVYRTIAKVLVWRHGVRCLSHLLLTSNNDFQVDLSNGCTFNEFTVMSVLSVTRVNSLNDVYTYCHNHKIALSSFRITNAGLLVGVDKDYLINKSLVGDLYVSKNSLFDEMADFIISNVQDKSVLSGFQYLVSFSEIEKVFGIKLEPDYIDCLLELLNNRNEVADVDFHGDNFDLTLFTDFAPNYCEGDYCEELETIRS